MKQQDSTNTRENATGLVDTIDIGRSRAFRQVVAIEVIWFVEPGESDFRDWEGVVRDAIASAEPPAWLGIGVVTEPEELVLAGQEPGR